jgi:hypothetical protein
VVTVSNKGLKKSYPGGWFFFCEKSFKKSRSCGIIIVSIFGYVHFGKGGRDILSPKEETL